MTITKQSIMGKKFTVISISSDKDQRWFLLCVVDSNDSSDLRYLHLEPRGELQDIGVGVEMDSERKIIHGGPGYSLREEHSKPVPEWSAGDVLIELYYPEDIDGRANK